MRDSRRKRTQDDVPGKMSVLRMRPDLKERRCYLHSNVGHIANYCRSRGAEGQRFRNTRVSTEIMPLSGQRHFIMETLSYQVVDQI